MAEEADATEKEEQATQYGVDVFGLPTVPHEENPLFADLASEEGEPPVGLAEAVQGEPPVAAPVIEPVVKGPEAVPVGASAEGAPISELILGKYKDQGALEKGYKDLSDLQRRTAERAVAYEQHAAAVEEKARQLEEALRRAIPVIQGLAQAQQQPRVAAPPEQYFDAYGNPVTQEPFAPQQPPMTPQVFQALLDQAVSERMAGAEEEMRTRFEAESVVREQEQSVAQFYSKHPEVEVRGETDNEIYEAIQALNTAWEPTGWMLDIADPEALEVAYEASKSPELRQVLELNPALADSDAGMTLARFQAALLKGEQPITQQTALAPASLVGQRKPVTERASGAVGANMDQPLDPWEEAVLAYRKERSKTGDSVFFE